MMKTAKTTVQTIDPNAAKQKVNDFMTVYKNDPNARFRSYDHAHKAFKNNMYNGKVTNDELAKELFVFLASWGMLRNAFLMKKDYKFLIPVVEIVRDKRYEKLMDIEIFSLGQPGNLSKNDYIALILELKDKIKECFLGKTYWDKDETGAGFVETDINRVSDTLIGKILLCVFGCIPAYDDNVKNAMRKLGICASISQKGLEHLLDWCDKQKAEIDDGKADCNAVVDTGCYYPDMKVVDIIFW